MRIEIGFRPRSQKPKPLAHWHRWFAIAMIDRWSATKATLILFETVERRQVIDRDGPRWEFRPPTS